MFANSLTVQTTNAEETADMAVRLGGMLAAGDVVLLSGDIGAGKTHFARHLIQSLQEHPEDVPSPSFTLVQTYETRVGEVWHTDLYRLSSPGEAEELGLSDAFETAICLVEWPDRMGDGIPIGALSIQFDLGENETERTLTFSWEAERWTKILEGAL